MCELWSHGWVPRRHGAIFRPCTSSWQTATSQSRLGSPVVLAIISDCIFHCVFIH